MPSAKKSRKPPVKRRLTVAASTADDGKFWAALPDDLRVSEIVAAERNRRTRGAVLYWIKSGALPAERVGRTWFVRKADYLAFKRANQT